MNQETIVKIIIGLVAVLVLALCVWAEHTWPDTKETLKLIENSAFLALAALGIYHAATTGPGGGQKGRCSLVFLALLAFVGVVVFALSGCTVMGATAYASAETVAKKGIQAFDDNTLTTLRDAYCGQPHSAFLRHPELIEGTDKLCGSWPGSGTLTLSPAQTKALVEGLPLFQRPMQ